AGGWSTRCAAEGWPAIWRTGAIVRVALGILDYAREPLDEAHRGLAGDLEPQMQLVCTDPVSGNAQQEAGLEPFVQRNVAALEHLADRRAELFTASATEFQAGACAFAGDGADAIGCAATCANRAIRPDNFLELGVRGLLIPEIGLQNDGHDRASKAPLG